MATCSSCRSKRREAGWTAERRGVATAVSAERFRGVRIFDISDVRKPRVAAVQTCRGSHTHARQRCRTTRRTCVYGSGTSTVRSGGELAGCSNKEPKEDPNTSLYSIDVIQIPLAAPEKARIVNRPRIFADPATGNIAGLWPGGTRGPGRRRQARPTGATTSRCFLKPALPRAPAPATASC